MKTASKKILAPVLGALAAVSSAFCSAEPPARPNVILILADDLGMGDLSFYNNGLNDTPNMDNLLKSGVNFRNAYAGSAVCAPSRAALLTGMWPHRTGCVTLNPDNFPELVRIKKGIPTMADLFRDNGYATGLIGKWHCGRQEGYYPWNRGFTHVESFSLAKDNDDYFKFGVRTESGETQHTARYLTDDIGDRAVAFVRRHRDRPFFLHLAHYAPHRPLQAPQEFVNKYKKRGFDEKTATVYAMVEIMDKNIGSLMAELEAQKLLEKTIIVFSSDNGQDPISAARFNMNFKGTKYTVNEGGIHVPFSIYWKGRAETAECAEMIHFVDVLPTLAGLCGLAVPANYDIDGKSFASCLPGFADAGGRETPDYFWQWNRGVPYYTHNAAVRRGKWKLVRPYVKRSIIREESTEAPVLYNIEDDPSESMDVSAKHKNIYNQLSVILEQWSRQVEHDRLSR